MLSGKMYRFRPDDRLMDSRFLEYYLVSTQAWNDIDGMKTGGNESGLNLTQRRFKTLRVPLAPRMEQNRIVDAIEQYLPRLEAALTSASMADRRLGQFHDAVLQSRFKTDWPRLPLDALNDPERPICYGILKPRTPEVGQVPYVEVRSIVRGRINVDGLHRTTRALHEEFRRSELKPGDVALAIRGSYDRAAVVPDVLAGANVSRDVARIAPVPDLHPAFLAAFLVSPEARRYFGVHARGVAVQGVNIGDLRRLPVPCPPRVDQQDALHRIEAARSAVDHVEAELRVAEARGNALRRSLLATAFSGRLVPQDESDRPVSELLERIKIQEPTKRRSRRKGPV